MRKSAEEVSARHQILEKMEFPMQSDSGIECDEHLRQDFLKDSRWGWETGDSTRILGVSRRWWRLEEEEDGRDCRSQREKEKMTDRDCSWEWNGKWKGRKGEIKALPSRRADVARLRFAKLLLLPLFRDTLTAFVFSNCASACAFCFLTTLRRKEISCHEAQNKTCSPTGGGPTADDICKFYVHWKIVFALFKLHCWFLFYFVCDQLK